MSISGLSFPQILTKLWKNSVYNHLLTKNPFILLKT